MESIAFSSPLAISNHGGHASLWRFHFSRKLFNTSNGAVYIGSYEAESLFELERTFFCSLVDCEAIYHVEKKKYNIENILRFRVDLLYQFCEMIFTHANSKALPILLYCSSSSLFAPIFGMALMLRYGAWEDSLDNLVQHVKILCSDMYTSYDTPTSSQVCRRKKK